MAATKKQSAPPCAHPETLMVSYILLGPHEIAGDHSAVFWCIDCGGLRLKRYQKGAESEAAWNLPRASRLASEKKP